MVSSYTNTAKTYATNDVLVFTNNAVKVGCTSTHVAGSASFNLNSPGIYEVSFNGVATATAAGNMGVTMFKDGVAVPGALAAEYSTAGATGLINLSFTFPVRIPPECCANRGSMPATLTFVNTGVAGTFSNSAVTIKRVANCD